MLSEAAKWSDAVFIGHDAEFKGIAIDSRLVEPGSLFVAIKGKHVDGHHFIEDAKAQGASGALVSKSTSSSLPLLVAKDSVQGLGQLAAVWRQRHAKPL
jgi:UDP-N-acetylmuramoyl-tripeptide--D-alanyl-D-alanine ligase